MRGATNYTGMGADPTKISTNAPLAGGDRTTTCTRTTALPFQPTPPLRGATFRSSFFRVYRINFNQRPPCGGRLLPLLRSKTGSNFNQRPPCGGRHQNHGHARLRSRFQPTPPLRGATAAHGVLQSVEVISTNAPLAGGDPERMQRLFDFVISTNAPLAGGDLILSE